MQGVHRRLQEIEVHDPQTHIDDDASPDPETIVEREPQRADAQSELGLESAAKRFDREA